MGWVVKVTPRTLYPPGEKISTYCMGEMGGLQSQSGRVRKISPQTGFDPRTVQPVASRFAD